MAKRFTDTDKWRKPFMKGLPLEYKLLWLYILDDCDHAGIWVVDMEVAGIRIGAQLDEKLALELFADRVVAFDQGSKWFVRSFIEKQYKGQLNESNRVHSSVLSELKKHDLLKFLPYEVKFGKSSISPLSNFDKPLTENNKPLIEDEQGRKDKDKDKDKDKEKGGMGENMSDFESWEQIANWLLDTKSMHDTMAANFTKLGMRVNADTVRGMMVEFVQDREVANDTNRTMHDYMDHAFNFVKYKLRKPLPGKGVRNDADEPEPPSRKRLN